MLNEQLGSPNLRQVFSVLSLSRIVRYLTSPISAKVNAYFLGTYGIGVMSQINIMLGQSSVLVLHTVTEGTTKLISQAAGKNSLGDNLKVQEVVGTVLWYTIVISILFVTVIAISARPLARLLLNDPSMAPLIIIAAISFPISVLGELVSTILRGLSCFRTLSISLAVSSLLSLIVIIPLVIVWGLIGAAVALTLSSLAILVFNLILAWRDPIFRNVRPLGRPRIKWAIAIELSRYISATLIAGLLAPILILSARAIMVRQVGVDGLGIYAPVIIFAGFLIEAVRIPLSTIILPTISKQNSYTDITNTLNRALRFTCIALLCFGGTFIALRYFLVVLIYNDKFLMAATVMGPHLIGVALDVMNGGIGQLYFALPRLKALVIVDVLSKISFIGFTYTFGYLWGLWGLSFAYMGMYTVGFVFNYLYFKHEIGFSFSKELLWIGGLTLLLLMILSAIPLTTWYQMGLALVSIAVVGWKILGKVEQRNLILWANAVAKRMLGNRILNG